MVMERTIQMMKENNLFESTVQNVLHKNIPKDAMGCAIRFTMSIDEEFEDTFLQEAHDLAVDVIWSAVQEAVKSQEEKKTVEESLNELADSFGKLFKEVCDQFNKIIDDGK